jgi:antirestriction protein ArdC
LIPKTQPYAEKIIRTETDAKTGEDSECAIPFLKGYTVFNVEQIDGLPEHCYAKPTPRVDTGTRIERAETFLANTRRFSPNRRNRPAWRHKGLLKYLARLRAVATVRSFRDAESYYATRAHEMTHWTRHPSDSIGISVASVSAMMVTRRRSLLPNSGQRFCPPISN